MAEAKDIVFKRYWYSKTWNETKIYFVAPKSYLNGKYPAYLNAKYPEADSCRFILVHPGKKWDIDYAKVGISPFKDYGNGRSDYDWYPYICDPEFKQALYNIYENLGKVKI